MNNKHIINFIDYYTKLDYSPEYAILLSGEWGCGKTWLIKNYFKNNEEIDKIYISLYGLNKFSEIEDEFFNQLHPVLSSQGMALAGKVIKGLLKAGLKIDLTDSANINVNTDLPKIEISQFLINTKNYILIFDDLERSSFKIEKILGYINHFVEQQGQKVIILCYEKELKEKIEKSDELTKYEAIKEKLIGKSFIVKENTIEAFESFIKNVNNDKVRDVLKKNKDKILEVYRQSKFKNLRHIRFFLWEFERFYGLLPEFSKKNEQFLTNIISILFTLILENRQGHLNPQSLNKYYSNYLMEAQSNFKGDKKYTKITEKYTDFNPYNLLFPTVIWIEFLEYGTILDTKFEDYIKDTQYFVKDNSPSWRKLWDYYNLTDVEFEKLLKIVIKEFDKRVYESLSIIKHIVGMFMNFSELKLLDEDITNIRDKGFKYIDYLKDNNKISTQLKIDRWDDRNESAYGLVYQSLDKKEFKDFLSYINDIQKQVYKDNKPKEGQDLIKLMKNDTLKFSKQLTLTDLQGQYYDIPILQYIDSKEFINIYICLKPSERRLVGQTLKSRYRFSQEAQSLKDELEWLENLKKMFIIEQKKYVGKLSGFIINNFIEKYLNKSIAKLK